ncbi:unnamed protein product, partial [Brassica oleracea var. botrytis]
AFEKQYNRLHKLHRRPPLNSGHRCRDLAHHRNCKLLRHASSVASNNTRNLYTSCGSCWSHRRVLEDHLAPRCLLNCHACSRRTFRCSCRIYLHGYPQRLWSSTTKQSYLEYSLEDFSGFLRRRVQRSYKWERIRACLSTTSICPDLNQRFSLAQDFFNAYLSPIQSGCCKPPTKCGYTFVNATYWISPISLHVDMDCLQWSNDQNTLCYSCNSCKAGLLANLKIDWLEADIFLLVALIGLIIVYIIGCCVLRNSRTEDIFRKYKQGYT